MNKKGFTLMELLITIAIIGILAGIAVTAYVGSIKKAARSEAYSNLESLRLLEEQFFAENGDYAPASGSLIGTANIQAQLPGFKPGDSTNYNYAIIADMQITDNLGNNTANPPTTAATADPCFVATATGITGSRVCPNGPDPDCDLFAIDCNNNKNF
ncbi:MAG: hypothetical protein Fur0020_03030 [Thermodesulfovibrionia bacterium]